MNEFIDGLTQGLKEGPLVFASPLVALWTTLSSTAIALLARITADQA